MSILLGIAVGLVLGLTGAGGSILAVPLLVFGLGWTLPQAAPVALLAVAAAAAYGTYVAWRKSYVRYRAAILMGAAGWITAPVGLWLASMLPQPLLMGLFAAVMVVVALRMLVQARRHPEEAAIVRATVHGDGEPADGPICRLQPSGRIRWTFPCGAVLAAIGAGSGLLTGLLGVGGGFVIVPALRAATALSMHSAVATSLMVIALASSGAAASAGFQGQAIPWLIAAPFVAGSLAGMAGGRFLAPRIAGAWLQQGFAALVLVVALGMVMRVFWKI